VELLFAIAAVVVAWLYFKSHAAVGGSLPSPNPSTTSASYTPFSDLAVAWAHAEGWDTPGSLAQRNNNPVNIKGTGWTGQVGRTSQGFAVFSDQTYGFDAAQSYLQQQAAEHPDWTLRNLFAKILGNLEGESVNNDQGNSDQEAENVASYLGISPDTVLANYTGGNQ